MTLGEGEGSGQGAAHRPSMALGAGHRVEGPVGLALGGEVLFPQCLGGLWGRAVKQIMGGGHRGDRSCLWESWSHQAENRAPQPLVMRTFPPGAVWEDRKGTLWGLTDQTCGQRSASGAPGAGLPVVLPGRLCSSK